MFLFTSRPREHSVIQQRSETQVLPNEDDVAALRELERQRLKWGTFLESYPKIWSEEWLWMNRLVPSDQGGPIKKRFMQMFNSKTKLRKRVKGLIRSGVPPELRGNVWYACAGAEAKRRNTPIDGQYPEVLKRIHVLEKSQIALDIEKDLLRTFPDKISKQNSELVDALRRLLMAYALRNTRVGYCQSMNYICALLLFHMEEEKAFWTFSALLEDIMPSDYYVPSLVGGRIDQQVFQSCIAWKLPKVHECFKATNTVLEPIICPWFLCLYVNVLPLYTACRVWDCLFWEGSVVLFRIGLTLIKSKANEITKATDFIGIYSVLKGSSLRTYTFELEVNPENLTADGASVDNPVMSDTEFLIQSAFGYRWLRSVPKHKVDLLRLKFGSLMKEEENEKKARSKDDEDSGKFTSNEPTSPSSADSTAKAKKVNKTRKSELMAMLLDEKNVDQLRELAMQMDEGLGSHVEEFAREMHAESDTPGSPGAENEEDDEDGEDDEDEGMQQHSPFADNGEDVEEEDGRES